MRSHAAQPTNAAHHRKVLLVAVVAGGFVKSAAPTDPGGQRIEHAALPESRLFTTLC
jgi:hypothetical protein